MTPEMKTLVLEMMYEGETLRFVKEDLAKSAKEIDESIVQ